MRHPSLVLPVALAAAACSPTADPAFSSFSCADATTASCTELTAEDPQALLDAVNALDGDATVVLGSGTFTLDNQVTIRADDVVLIGQGIDVTLLDFAAQEAQTNGVDFVGNNFLLQDLTVANAKKDGVRVEDSDHVVFRNVKATWTNGPDASNGAYGLYPVKSNDVLIEGSEAWNASDAGLYVGQCTNAVVRHSLAKQNVAGIEIENTQFADVYGNTAEDNTGGLVVFDLPGNPIIGRDIHIHENIVRNNNRPNFGPSGTVRQIPAGTGTFAMASRRVEIESNTYENNGSVDIALISGLAIEPDVSKWALDTATLVGTWEDLDLDVEGGVTHNFRTDGVYVHDNTHTGGGTAIDNGSIDDRPLGFLLGVLYGQTPVDTILYDAIGESSYDATSAEGNSNDNHICIGSETDATFASLAMDVLIARFEQLDLPSLDDVYRPDAPFAPFNCGGLPGDPIQAPTVTDVD
ncbi:MAG: right-handed parallel beta-helix repeat-containing protein [Alphaproteobacteria bacterium]|nr:right-handed parallel beta-helix repeat-containing protein [Alphaproteobacteria bacterium]